MRLINFIFLSGLTVGKADSGSVRFNVKLLITWRDGTLLKQDCALVRFRVLISAYNGYGPSSNLKMNNPSRDTLTKTLSTIYFYFFLQPVQVLFSHIYFCQVKIGVNKIRFKEKTFYSTIIEENCTLNLLSASK